MRDRSVKSALPRLVTAALVALMLAPAGAASASVGVGGTSNLVLTSPMAQAQEPVTVYSATTFEINTLDPQLTEDTTSVTPVENLFLGLTDLDPQTTKPRPEMATEWTVSDDGTIWTYTLRGDVPWVRYDPKTGETTEVRKVVADDFVYGIRRACDPRTGGQYSYVAAAMIKGCDVTVRTPISDFNDSMLEEVGVKALSDTQLEVTLQGALGYWEAASSMWVFRPVPKEAISEFGDQWTEPGNIITNGPFVLAEWNRQVSRTFLKNPLYPEGVTDTYGGNVERISISVVGDGSTIYTLYQNNEIESSGVPQAELETIRNDAERSKELRQAPDLSVSYVGFMYDKPPFDNVHVRRAFSAMIDRNALVSEVLQNRALPMAHFTPPGILGAPPINEVGVGQPDTPGFDAEYAKKELELGGFPNCENFPEVTILSTDDTIASIIQNAMQTVLGCDPAKLIPEQVDFKVLLETIKPDTPTAQRPHMFTLGWAPDYPDAHNWLHDVLSCKTENAYKRPCDEKIDGKIEEAAKITDTARRVELYREVEELFFGPEGDFPMAPLWTNINIFLVKPWFTYFAETDGLFGGNHWDSYKIDQAAQLAARGK